MKSHRIDEEPRNVLLLSLAVWGSVVAGAAAGEAFTKFDANSAAYFAVGAALYAFAAYRLDRGMHTYIQGFSRPGMFAVACLTLATLAIAWIERMPALAVFAAPIVSVSWAAAVEKLALRATKARGKSPAGSRAAT